MNARAVPARLTDGRSNGQLLYFTGPSLTADDRHLVFLGDASRPARGPYDPDALVDVWVLDRADGSLRRLTSNRVGVRRSYVYFGGHDDAGIAPGSVALAAEPRIVCYLDGTSVRRVGVASGDDRQIGEVATGLANGYGALSDDGARYCLPVMDASAFADLHAIDATVLANGLVSPLLGFDAVAGGLVDDVAVPDGWVTHVAFRPGDPTTILYNHEWASDGGARRIWLWDGRSRRTLRAVGEGGPATPEDEVEHETWTRDGARVVYHGRYAAGPHPLAGRAFVGWIEIATGCVSEIPLPDGDTRYGHVATGPAGSLVTDGLAAGDAWGPATAASRGPVPPRIDAADAPPEDDGGAWISRLDPDWTAGALRWTPLVRHGSSWSSQDAHPHPIFDHSGRSILYTSDEDGFRAVYEVPAVVAA
jgi:hypothetical protein